MYSVMSYGFMAADGVRMDAYARAIARTVTPSSIVLDLGAGTGVLSLMAARAGARKVYAVDTNPAVLLLNDLAAENGLGDRIEIHDRSSLELDIPEGVDVILSDLRGSTPLNGEHFAVIQDARERLLRPGGRLVPAEDHLMVALVDSSRLERDLATAVRGFVRNGLSASAASASMRNTVYVDGGSELAASDVLSSPARWATITYAGELPGLVEGDVDVTVTRAGRANALAVWFDAIVLPGLGYSTAPGHVSAYSRMLLPLLEPLDVEAGDRVRTLLRADVRGDRWAWDTAIAGADGAAKASLRQATFLGMPASKDALLRSASTYAPRRSARGERLHRVLAGMDGARSVSALADELTADFSLPADVALEEVRDAVGRYAR